MNAPAADLRIKDAALFEPFSCVGNDSKSAAVYTAKDSTARLNAANGRITGVGYIELEAPSVEASIAFYEMVLGFEVESRRARPGEATLKMASGQTLILTQAPFASKGLVMSRTVPGPQIAFYVSGATWPAALEHLEKLGIENGPRRG